jgi:hypothetical protein
VGFLIGKVLSEPACQPPRCLCVDNNSVEYVGIESFAGDVQKEVFGVGVRGRFWRVRSFRGSRSLDVRSFRGSRSLDVRGCYRGFPGDHMQK